MKSVLGILLIFTLGNSSDAFLLLKAQRHGVPVAMIPALWSFLHVVKAATSVPGGWVSDRIGRKPLLVAGWMIYAATYAGFAFAGSALSIWILFAVYGLFFGLTEGVEKALISDLAPADLKGSAFGLYNFIIGVGAFLASIVFGGLWQRFGEATAFGAGAVFAILAALLMLLLRPLHPGGQLSSR
jgi:MFS family permease